MRTPYLQDVFNSWAHGRAMRESEMFFLCPPLRSLCKFWNSSWALDPRSERAFSAVVRSLAGSFSHDWPPAQREQVVVAFGNASAGHGSCLSTSTPDTELVQCLWCRARVLLVGERKATKLYCHATSSCWTPIRASSTCRAS